MGGNAKMNAMKSGIVVVGAVAFGYLTLQYGFRPFLEQAQAQSQAQHTFPASDSSQQQLLSDDSAILLSDSDSYHDSGDRFSKRLP